MKSPLLEQIVSAVLYEGYILYPYRSSSIKNKRERFTFGRIYPKDYSDSQKGAEPCANLTECLLKPASETVSVEIIAGFLQPIWREVGYLSGADKSFRRVDQLSVGNVVHHSWQEAVERKIPVALGPLSASETRHATVPFAFDASRTVEMLGIETSAEAAVIQRRLEAVSGVIEIAAAPLPGGILKISVRICNLTPMSAPDCESQDAVIMRTFASTHAVLHAIGGEFISLLEPPDEFADAAAACKNTGVWPVLVGDKQKAERDTLLSSPIILYDYPEIAAASKGSFFDGTEIDEILTLRVMTMTDAEKLEMRQVDEFARGILERSESATAEDFLKMHGVMHGAKNVEEFFNPTRPLQEVALSGRKLKAGDRVRIQPKRRADAIDMLIAGKIGIIEAIEQDAEEGIHLALVLEDDPGKDMGLARQTGHRFFYGLDEVEPLADAAT
ncbi:MAG TPA: hypothetical protein VH413_12385 [Verrucomicrobiae bacterium]|jgi:hypothetical protein|nr:hypothetical protein [Verrucomicrobiae bacterium]